VKVTGPFGTALQSISILKIRSLQVKNLLSGGGRQLDYSEKGSMPNGRPKSKLSRNRIRRMGRSAI